MVRITRPIYRDMLLTHNIGYSATLQPDSPFHWQLLRPQVANDLTIARSATASGG